MKLYQFKSLWREGKWLAPAYVLVDEQGRIAYLGNTAPGQSPAIEYVDGFALPGFQNAHSHAFQYAMAGLAENHPADVTDDFWTWREAMYTCALSLDPDEYEAIAAMLYAEMVRHGYTHVAEFHYLHHQKNGKPYDNIAEMGERMLAAAATAGIKIALIPVFYQRANFGVEYNDRQRRFISPTLDDYLALWQASEAIVREHAFATVGVSVHSLRAVDLPAVQEAILQCPQHLPFHVHVAEQRKEVEDCVKYSGQRPVEWLLNNVALNERFHLVHATHLSDWEVDALPKTGAHVVLCPSTEGNLGDGFFRMREFISRGGRWSVGTDSHIGINLLEELRMLDYRQRLVSGQRNTFANDAAAYMIDESQHSGRAAMGTSNSSALAIGQPLDVVVFNAGSHLVANTSAQHRMATLLYTSDSSRISGTMINGRWVVKSQHHQNGHQIKMAFNTAMKRLLTR